MQFVKGNLVFYLNQTAFWHRSALLSDSAKGIKPVLSTFKQFTSGNAKQLLSTWVFGFAKSDKSADLCQKAAPPVRNRTKVPICATFWYRNIMQSAC